MTNFLYVNFVLISVDLPPLMQLIFGEPDSDLQTIRWNLLFWLLKISADKKHLVEALPKDYMLISTTLLFMIQVTAINYN